MTNDENDEQRAPKTLPENFLLIFWYLHVPKIFFWYSAHFSRIFIAVPKNIVVTLHSGFGWWVLGVGWWRSRFPIKGHERRISEERKVKNAIRRRAIAKGTNSNYSLLSLHSSLPCKTAANPMQVRCKSHLYEGTYRGDVRVLEMD